MGRTGSLLAKYATAFDMNICYYDPFVEGQYKRINSLEELLSVSDIVSLHVHLDNTTENLVNSSNSTSFKNGAYLINTSRGGIVDEVVLVDLLERGILKGVATDVIKNELGSLAESPLHQAQVKGLNVIITPHIGGATHDALNMCEEFLSEKLVQHLSDSAELH